MNKCLFKIGPTQATMRPVTWYGLGIPDNSFVPYAVARMCGDMSAKSYGFPSDVWRWSSADQAGVSELIDMFENDDDASVELYIHTLKDNGEWADFLTQMYRPVNGDGKTVVPSSKSDVLYYTNVMVKFAHMVEL